MAKARSSDRLWLPDISAMMKGWWPGPMRYCPVRNPSGMVRGLLDDIGVQPAERRLATEECEHLLHAEEATRPVERGINRLDQLPVLLRVERPAMARMVLRAGEIPQGEQLGMIVDERRDVLALE